MRALLIANTKDLRTLLFERYAGDGGDVDAVGSAAAQLYAVMRTE